MARKTLAQIYTDAGIILEDPTPTIFANTTKIVHVRAGLREISRFVPHRPTERHIMAARHRSRDIDLSDIIADVVDVNYAIYPVLLENRDGDLIDDCDLDLNRKNVEKLGNSIRMLMNAAPRANETNKLTGTVTFTDGSTAITGSGTAFTTELRKGYCIRKNTEWYRVAAIADDTNLTLATNVLTADDGADSEDNTGYWRSDVYVDCDKVHILTEQVDLAGAVKALTSNGAWSLTVDSLTDTQVVVAGQEFTIAGVDGTYRNLTDQTVASNEVTMNIEPALRGVAPATAVVTFQPSTLTPHLERILAEYVAAQCAINWLGKGRTAINEAIAHMDTGDDTLNTVTLTANAARDYLAYATSRMGIGPRLIDFKRWGYDTLGKVMNTLSKLEVDKTFETYAR